MKVYEFAYSDCIHSSGCVTMSIHSTRKGAEMALAFHKEDARREYLEMYGVEEREYTKFGDMEHWIISETEVLD